MLIGVITSIPLSSPDGMTRLRENTHMVVYHDIERDVSKALKRSLDQW